MHISRGGIFSAGKLYSAKCLMALTVYGRVFVSSRRRHFVIKRIYGNHWSQSGRLTHCQYSSDRKPHLHNSFAMRNVFEWMCSLCIVDYKNDNWFVSFLAMILLWLVSCLRLHIPTDRDAHTAIQSGVLYWPMHNKIQTKSLWMCESSFKSIYESYNWCTQRSFQ